MKSLIKTAFAYAVAAMAGGVFYREFTKLSQFTGETTLSVVHTHLFMLGMFGFLITALLYDRFHLEGDRKFKIFRITYNIGLILTTVMLIVRGVLQVCGSELSKGLDASISGLSGIGHILTGVGIVFLFLALLKHAGRELGNDRQ